MKENFNTALAETLKHEGGFSNHPADPGGATMRGVILTEYQKFRRNPHLTAEDLKKITDEELREIYYGNYWKPCRCDDLPSGVDVCVFDLAVNSGIGRSAKVLQECVGAKPDGVIGPVTLGLVANTDTKKLIADIQAARQAFLERLKTFPVFGKGWTRRVSEVKEFALKIA